ncbi:MAG: hypothetical protein KKC19_00160 [Nanoarchaeota archaeon]|nr:hypothetical protein [Nanoarchaeota archaeon]
MKISDEKREKISEHILALLYSHSPQALFTSEVAKEMARDEEFMKTVLLNLKKKKLVQEIKKNPKGKDYLKRSRWSLTDAAYNAYSRTQDN